MHRNHHAFKPSTLGYMTFFLPVLTFHTYWLVSMAQGVFEPCFPYWAGCVSISHTGRHELSYFIFKGGMIPTAVLLILFWILNRRWLLSISAKDTRALSILAVIGSLALIAYTLALGHAGDQFRMIRRFGVVLFMFCTFVAQVMLGSALRQNKSERIQTGSKSLLLLSAATLSVAIFSLILDAALGGAYDRLEDAFEWWLIMMLLVHLLLTVRLWVRSGYRLMANTS